MDRRRFLLTSAVSWPAPNAIRSGSGATPGGAIIARQTDDDD
jgi:hypothetical protein